MPREVAVALNRYVVLGTVAFAEVAMFSEADRGKLPVEGVTVHTAVDSLTLQLFARAMLSFDPLSRVTVRETVVEFPAS